MRVLVAALWDVVVVGLMHEQQPQQVHCQAHYGDRQQPVRRHVVTAAHDVHASLQHDVERHEHEDDGVGKARQHAHPAEPAVSTVLNASAVSTMLLSATTMRLAALAKPASTHTLRNRQSARFQSFVLAPMSWTHWTFRLCRQQHQPITRSPVCLGLVLLDSRSSLLTQAPGKAEET